MSISVFFINDRFYCEIELFFLILCKFYSCLLGVMKFFYLLKMNCLFFDFIMICICFMKFIFILILVKENRI